MRLEKNLRVLLGSAAFGAAVILGTMSGEARAQSAIRLRNQR